MARSDDNGGSRFDPSQRLIVLCGSERFLIEEYTRKIATMLESHFGGIEQFAFDGLTAEPAALLDELRSYGLMQRHKLVILDHADLFLAGKKTLGSADDEDDQGGGDAGEDESEGGARRPMIERYAASPVDDATLVMRCRTWRKSKLDTLIAKHGVIVKCDEQPADLAARWCVNRCERRYEAKLEPEAATLMVKRLGPSLQRLDTELLKLASMAGKGQVITVDLVEQQIAPSHEEKAWVIQSAAAGGSAPAMLEKLDDLLRDGPAGEWVPVSWALIDLMRKQHAAAHLLRRNTSPQAIMRELKLFGDAVGPILAAARKHEPAAFAQLLREAVRADHRSKSGLGSPRRNLEALMVKIADVSDVAAFSRR